MDIKLYASTFLVNDRREVLLVREGKKHLLNKWNLPGGHVEEDESFYDAAVREAAEETGLSITPSGVLMIFDGPKHYYVHCVYLASDYSGNISINDPNILEVKWIPIETLDAIREDLLHPEKFEALLAAFKDGKAVSTDILHAAT